MEIRVVIDGISYEFGDYGGLRELLDERASKVSQTNEQNGVYLPERMTRAQKVYGSIKE